MNGKIFSFLMLPVTLLAVGCASPQTFDVTVTNRTSDPISVWMTKEKPVRGDNYERGWMPPEVLAVGNTEKMGGAAVSPGSTAHTVLKGTIARDDVAVLRVYRAVELDAILSLSRGNPDRLDLPLNPGRTDIDIVTKNGRLQEVPHGRDAARY
jgi:hypothetical protein